MKDKYLLILFAINLVFFLPYITNPDLLTGIDNDLGRTYIPIYSFISDTFQNYKQIPLWNQMQMMGDSFIGNPLSTVFYPLNIIFYALPIKIASVIFLLAHFLIASFSTYFLAKTFGFSKTASFAAAIFFAFSTKMLVHLEAGHITMVAAFSYFPLLFLSIRKLLNEPKFSYIVLGAVSATFMFITYLTIFYYATIFIGVYAIFKLLQSKFSIQKLYPFAFLALIAFGLCAIALLPQIEFAKYSTRTQLKYEDVAQPLFNQGSFVSSLVMPYPNLTRINHEAFLYLGAMPLILSFIGFTKLKSSQKIILGIFTAITILFVAGQSTPVFRIAYDHLPYLDYSRITTRIWFIPVLLVSLLAAFAINRIKNPKIIYLVMFIFLAESIFIYRNRIQNVAQLNFKDESMYQFLAKDTDIFRVYCTAYCFNPQLLSKYKLEQLAGETPLQNKNFVNFLQKAGNYQYDNFAVIFPPYQIWQIQIPPVPNSKLLGEANVKYVGSTYQINDEKLRLIEKFDQVYIYQNQDFQKRFRFENSTGQINIEKITPNYVDLTFEKLNSPQNLIISQNYYPGWYAQIDGAKYEVEKYNDVFQIVPVPSGAGKVQIRYEPRTLLAGKTITFATIIFALIYFLYAKKENRKT